MMTGFRTGSALVRPTVSGNVLPAKTKKETTSPKKSRSAKSKPDITSHRGSPRNVHQTGVVPDWA